MYGRSVFITLQELYSIIIIIFTLVFSSTKGMPDKTWPNNIQDLSAIIHNYRSEDKTMESHPLNEGFIILSDDTKKPPLITSKSADLSPVKRVFKSYTISSTTCKTITIVKPINHTSPPIVDHSVGHLGRRLLNEPSYDTDIEISSIKTPIETDDEIESFLKVDNEKLSKELFNIEVTVDGSGDTTEPTSKTTTVSNEPITTEKITAEPTSMLSSIPTLIMSTSTTTSTSTISITSSTTASLIISLSAYSRFSITVDCTNASSILTKILEQFAEEFHYWYNVTYDNNTLLCPKSLNIEVPFTFMTDNNITILTNLFITLANIVSSMGIELKSIDKCGTNETVQVENVTSCYLIDLCSLCGTNPPRGVCLPENGVSKCECFVNQNDPSILYTGDFCLPQNQEPITSLSSDWTPIIVGILAGVAGLFCMITCYLFLTIYLRRRRSRKQNISDQDELRDYYLWHLPRAQMPTSVTTENVQSYLNNTISRLSSNRNNTIDSKFFQELDQKMGENLRATITRPNTSAMLASLPSNIISIQNSYDPIDELDAIIDNEDTTMILRDPLNNRFQDDEMLEVTNPNLKLLRLNVDFL